MTTESTMARVKLFQKGRSIMNSKLLLIGLTIILGVFYNGCEPEQIGGGGGPAGPTTAVVTGRVTDNQSQIAVPGADVNLTQFARGISVTVSTDNFGTYRFDVDLGDTSSTVGIITVSKTGYRQKFFNSVPLDPGGITQLDLTIDRDTTTPPGGGGAGTTFANTIAFIGASPNQLAVYGSGGSETSIITYEVRDSLGFPVDINHSEIVSFSLVPAGFGGAYITPTSVATNASGRVAITANSGTIAGTIQILARVTRRGTVVPADTIRSEPVRIIIHGGLPDLAHFGIGANPINVPGLDVNLVSSQVTAIVGDIYGNPVQQNTAVYFTTDEGIITTNTGFTNPNGLATVTLFSGPPRAANGFGTISSRTQDRNLNQISVSMPILFSGEPRIDSLAVVGGGPLVVSTLANATLIFTVRDRNLNPVVAGTFISAGVTGASAITSAVAPSNSIPDTQDPFWTRFTVVVSKDLDAIPLVTGAITVSITASGSNGSASATIYGTVN